jgi:hypothetical protein
MTIDAVWIGYRIYCALKQLVATIYKSPSHTDWCSQSPSSLRCLVISSNFPLLPVSRPRRLAAISHQIPTLLSAVSRLVIKVKVTLLLTVCQSVNLGHEPHLTCTVLFLWGALSDERTGLSFVYAAGPCQRSLARVRVSRNSRPYFTVSDLRLGQSQSYITTDGQPASLSWNKASIWGLRPDLDYCLTFAGLLVWGILSDERTGLPFTIAAGPCQRSLSRVRVPWDSRPYFAVSDLRLPFSSSPTTRRVTVEVFDPASTRESLESRYIAAARTT